MGTGTARMAAGPGCRPSSLRNWKCSLWRGKGHALPERCSMAGAPPWCILSPGGALWGAYSGLVLLPVRAPTRVLSLCVSLPGNGGGAVQRVSRTHQTGQERPGQDFGGELQLLRPSRPETHTGLQTRAPFLPQQAVDWSPIQLPKESPPTVTPSTSLSHADPGSPAPARPPQGPLWWQDRRAAGWRLHRSFFFVSTAERELFTVDLMSYLVFLTVLWSFCPAPPPPGRLVPPLRCRLTPSLSRLFCMYLLMLVTFN